MKQYLVTATKNRKVKTVEGSVVPPDGYIVYSAYHRAKSAEAAIDNAVTYYINGKYDHVRAIDVNEIDD